MGAAARAEAADAAGNGAGALRARFVRGRSGSERPRPRLVRHSQAARRAALHSPPAPLPQLTRCSCIHASASPATSTPHSVGSTRNRTSAGRSGTGAAPAPRELPASPAAVAAAASAATPECSPRPSRQPPSAPPLSGPAVAMSASPLDEAVAALPSADARCCQRAWRAARAAAAASTAACLCAPAASASCSGGQGTAASGSGILECGPRGLGGDLPGACGAVRVAVCRRLPARRAAAGPSQANPACPQRPAKTAAAAHL